MALDVAVGSFNIGTGAAASTVTITPGFTTKALILWWNGRTNSTDSGGSATVLRGMGFATSASAFGSWCCRDEDAAATSATARAYRTDACILEISDSALVGWADVQSINSTQVVFEILDQFVTDMRIFYIAYGGSDITAAEVGTFTATGSAPVNQIVTTSTQGKLVLFGGIRLATVNTATAGSNSFFGGASSSSDEYVWAGRSRDAQNSGDAVSYSRAGECIAFATDTSSATTDRAEFVSFNATPSFTINWLERASAHVIFYLQLSGTFQVALGDILTLNSTGTITETGIAFQPTSLLLASANRAANTADVPTANDELSLGAATGSGNQLVAQSSVLNGNTTMFTQTFVEYDAIYNNVDPSADTIEGKADFTAFTSDGFTLNMSDADPSAYFAWYLAMASAAVPPAFIADNPFMVRNAVRRASFH